MITDELNLRPVERRMKQGVIAGLRLTAPRDFAVGEVVQGVSVA